MKYRIRQNVWGNWYGYAGPRRVVAFGTSIEWTAEQEAKHWLSLMNELEARKQRNAARTKRKS